MDSNPSGPSIPMVQYQGVTYSTSFFGPYFQIVSFLSLQPVWADRAKVYDPPTPLGGLEVGGLVEGWVGGWVTSCPEAPKPPSPPPPPRVPKQ